MQTVFLQLNLERKQKELHQYFWRSNENFRDGRKPGGKKFFRPNHRCG